MPAQVPDLQSYYNTPELQQARQQAQTAGQNAINYQSAGAQLPFKLREAVQGKLDYNKDLIEQRNQAMAEYFQAPSAAREEFQDIWNPFQREKLVAESRAQSYLPYANLTDILGQRMGTISDIINAGTGAFQAQTGAAQGAAGLANQNYSNLFSLADTLAGAANTQYGNQRQQELDAVSEELERARIAKSGSGGGGGIDLASVIAAIYGNQGQSAQPTSPTPLYTPREGYGATSNDGQWIFTKQGWIPASQVNYTD
jgi:hypothetical protein